MVWGLTHFGVGPYVARVISLGLCVAFTFCLNRMITYSAAGPVTWGEVIAYIGASGMGICINYLLYAGGIKLGLPWLLAMAIGTLIASAFNFFAYGRIFKKT
jgi:putative flippase GtrA